MRLNIMTKESKITVIFGPNGSGKTRYAEDMRRKMASDSLRYIAFSDAYGAATDKAYYLQLRWNQHDIDEETPRVGELLEKAYLNAGNDTPERSLLRQQLYEIFDIEPFLDKYVILLSSGELRKFQLVKALLSHPTTLILDNPFIGLDAETRQLLNTLLFQLNRQQSINLYLLLSKREDVPDYADEIIYLGDSNDKQTNVQPTEYYAKEMASIEADMTENHNPSQSDVVVEMNKVSIRYGERTILRDLDWVIRKGERWALCGQNGSGKSTLLSLICADNPQSYACDIKLFGNQRGHGESIWEIKRRIGYVSPEMHRSYMRNIPTINVVASGLKDTVGLYIRANESEKNQCLKWMRLFGIEHLAQRSFLTLSSGEQRLALVARAFVKCPELLILDEPLHGLDNNNRRLVKNIIDAYCQDKSKTLIMVTHYEEELPECITKRKTLEKIQ